MEYNYYILTILNTYQYNPIFDSNGFIIGLTFKLF
jgi:hypothetical protein